MTKKEIAEIKKLFKKDSGIIHTISGCYVDAEKQIKLLSKDAYYSLPEEDCFKYEEIFRKVLSGSLGRNLNLMEFPLEEELEGGKQEFLYKLRNTELEDDDVLMEFYQKVIEYYSYAQNYYIILIDIKYDVPGKGKDSMELYDASEEVYHAILCAICPVNLSKASLSYNAETLSIQNRVRDWIVDAPMTGFLFPSFRDRSTDIHTLLYYSKNVESLGESFIHELFGTYPILSANEQKEVSKELLAKVLEDEPAYEIMEGVYEKLQDMIAENAENGIPLELDKGDMKAILKNAGAGEEVIEKYEAMADEEVKFVAENIIDTKKFEVKRNGIIIKAEPEFVHLISTRVIDGKHCLVIEAEHHIEVNGVPIRMEE